MSRSTEKHPTAALFAMRLAGCTVGPDFVQPAALEDDADAQRAASASTAAARVTLDLVRAQQRAGYASVLQLLNAEQSYQTAVLSQVLAQSGRFAEPPALFQALGRGWWNRADARMGVR